MKPDVGSHPFSRHHNTDCTIGEQTWGRDVDPRIRGQGAAGIQPHSWRTEERESAEGQTCHQGTSLRIVINLLYAYLTFFRTSETRQVYAQLTTLTLLPHPLLDQDADHARKKADDAEHLMSQMSERYRELEALGGSLAEDKRRLEADLAAAREEVSRLRESNNDLQSRLAQVHKDCCCCCY